MIDNPVKTRDEVADTFYCQREPKLHFLLEPKSAGRNAPCIQTILTLRGKVNIRTSGENGQAAFAHKLRYGRKAVFGADPGKMFGDLPHISGIGIYRITKLRKP